MPRYTKTTIDRLPVCIDVDGNVSVIDADGLAILTLGKAVRNDRSGWHAFPMNDDGTLWNTPCHLRTRKGAIRYMAAMTAWADRIDHGKIA